MLTRARLAAFTVASGAWALAAQGLACSGAGEPAAAPMRDAAANEPIVVGVDLSLTGNLGSFGQAQQQAVKVAETQINAVGGVLGRQLEFRILDDGTNVARARKNLEELLAARVPIVLGPTGSPQASEVHALAFDAKVALISPSASTPDVAEAQPPVDRYFFRTAASHALQANAVALKAARGIAGGPACRRAAVVHADDSYGKPIADGFRARFERLGGAVVAPMTKVPSALKADYKAEAQAVAASGADCLIVATFPDVGVQYLRDFKKAQAAVGRDWTRFVSIGTNGLRSKDFLDKGRDDPANPSSPTVGEGMFVVNFDLAPDIPTYKQLRNLFASQFPLKAGQTELDGYTANAYDAAVLIALAMEDARSSTDGAAIRDALFRVSSEGLAFGPADVGAALAAVRAGDDVDYAGASGPVDFDDEGDVLANFVVNKVQGGAFVALPDDTITVEQLR